MLSYHASYDPKSGLFTHKSNAAYVADRIRVIMARRFKDFNTAAVQIGGKKGLHWIEFPALQMFWHPREVDANEFATQLKHIADAFGEIYDRTDKDINE